MARALGLKRAMDAHAAFVRAVRSRPEAERAALSKRESLRLDQLEKRIRSRDARSGQTGAPPHRPRGPPPGAGVSASSWGLTSAVSRSITAASGLAKCVALAPTNSGGPTATDFATQATPVLRQVQARHPDQPRSDPCSVCLRTQRRWFFCRSAGCTVAQHTGCWDGVVVPVWSCCPNHLAKLLQPRAERRP